VAVGLGWSGGSVGSGVSVRVGTLVGGRLVLVAAVVGVAVAVAKAVGMSVAGSVWKVAPGCANGTAVAVE